MENETHPSVENDVEDEFHDITIKEESPEETVYCETPIEYPIKEEYDNFESETKQPNNKITNGDVEFDEILPTSEIKEEINIEIVHFDDVKLEPNVEGYDDEKSKPEADETILSDIDSVVPVAIKTNSEFTHFNNKSDDADVELIVPLENPLQIPIDLNGGVVESKEVIIGDKIEDVALHLPDDDGDLLTPRGFACVICGKAYKNVNLLSKHQRAHETPIEFPKTSNGKSEPIVSISELANNRKKSEGVYSCGCGKQFKRKTSVASCMKVHQNAGVGCQWCPLVFQKSLDLRRHCRLDHKLLRQSKFSCSTCNKKFISKRALRVHRKKHRKKVQSMTEINHNENDSKTENTILDQNNETSLKFKFVCQICKEEFSTLGALTVHKTKHKKHMYKCYRCHQKFSLKQEFLTHREFLCKRGNVTPPAPKTSACSICEEVFPTEALMLQHKSTHPYLIFAKDDCTNTQIFFK